MNMMSEICLHIWAWWLHWELLIFGHGGCIGNLYGYGWMPGFVIMCIGNSLYGVTMTWTWCQRYASIFGRGGCIRNIGNSLYGVTMTWIWCQRYASIFGRSGCIGNLYAYGWMPGFVIMCIGNSLYGVTMTWTWCQRYASIFGRGGCIGNLWLWLIIVMSSHSEYLREVWLTDGRSSPSSTVTCDLWSQII